MSHESPNAESVEWFTPPELFTAMGETFDMDVCSPKAGPVAWVPARRFVSPDENGLIVPWQGFIWCNPPFGVLARRFAERMVMHNDGVILLPARTDTRFFQHAAPASSCITFIRERLYFIRADGHRDRSPFASVLLAFGDRGEAALRHANLGFTTRAEPMAMPAGLGL